MTGLCPFSSAVVPRSHRGMNDSKERGDEESQCNSGILFWALNDKYQQLDWLSAGAGCRGSESPRSCQHSV